LILNKKKGTFFYRFENLAACQGIDHRVFTRNSGLSQHPFASLNVAFGIGDEKENVVQNRNIISRSMAPGDLVFVRQVHGITIADFSMDGRGLGNDTAHEPFTADAMLTDRPHMYLVIQVADCQAVLMYETARRVAANVHCGWRGSIQNILGLTVETMKQRFDCNPENIQAGIGPSLGPCCAEFINYKTEMPRNLWRYKDSNHYFDFWSVSLDQLMRAGVPKKNIELSRICTSCRTDEFFSYRAEKTTGRFAAVIGLK
jgi:YfiH family protein